MEHVDVWTATLASSMSALWGKVAAFLPNFVAFIVILTVGWIVARLGSSAIRHFLKLIRADEFSGKVGIQAVLERANVKYQFSDILASTVFWLLMLTFMVSATESLGLQRVSGTIDGFVQYIPKILGAAFILMVGLLIAQFIRDLITSSAESIGSDYAKALGTAAYGVQVVIVVVLAVGQLELETQLLSYVVSIVLLSLGLATALAFGLGARAVAGNILAGTYVRDLYRVGDELVIEGRTGVVTQVTALKTELKTHDGELITISNTVMVDNTVTRIG